MGSYGQENNIELKLVFTVLYYILFTKLSNEVIIRLLDNFSHLD